MAKKVPILDCRTNSGTAWLVVGSSPLGNQAKTRPLVAPYRKKKRYLLQSRLKSAMVFAICVSPSQRHLRTLLKNEERKPASQGCSEGYGRDPKIGVLSSVPFSLFCPHQPGQSRIRKARGTNRTRRGILFLAVPNLTMRSLPIDCACHA